MSGLDVDQFRALVVLPTLHHLGLHSLAAENLLLGTAAQESRFEFLHQVGGGPARGLYQCEPATHRDVHDNFLAYKPDLYRRVMELASPRAETAAGFDDELITNLAYATAIARVHYLRVPKPLPEPWDVSGLAAYWKQHYNTPLGHGTVEQFEASYHRLVARGLD